LRAQASSSRFAIVCVAVVVGLGVFRPLTQHRERGGGAFGGRKPIAHCAEHGGGGDLILSLRQLISNLIKRGDRPPLPDSRLERQPIK
jgi:hypothetical protein